MKSATRWISELYSGFTTDLAVSKRTLSSILTVCEAEAGGFSWTQALADFDASATLVAVTCTRSASSIVAGAVYIPLAAIEPKLGLNVQLTSLLDEPLTLAWKA